MKPRVFVASSTEGLRVAYAVQENLEHDAHVTVWPQGTFNPSSYPMESLVEQIAATDFAIFVFSPDDELHMRNEQHEVVRDNVILEFGLFAGKISRHRCFMVQPQGVTLHLPTDLLGLNPATYDQGRPANELSAALGPACNKIRNSMERLGPLVVPVEKVITELDEKCLLVMARFGNGHFSRPSPGTWDLYVFDQGVERLRTLKCLRFEFEVEADVARYAYHWEPLGLDVLKKVKMLRLDKPSPDPESGRGTGFVPQEMNPLAELNTIMGDLLREMRHDLTTNPLWREFVLLKRTWSYLPSGDELCYFYNEHADLDSKVHILENHGYIKDVTTTSVKRYRMMEDFVALVTTFGPDDEARESPHE